MSKTEMQDKAQAWLSYIKNDSFFKAESEQTTTTAFRVLDYHTILYSAKRRIHEIQESNQYKTMNSVSDESVETIALRLRGKCAILNFASFTNPGGGFLSGQCAQEECLCHVSSLYPELHQFEYPYYVPNAAIKQKGVYAHCLLISHHVPFMVDNTKFVTEGIITCAAPNYSYWQRYNQYDDDLKSRLDVALRERMEIVYVMGALEGFENVVLGAWGCGVFKCDPTVVAEQWKSLSEKYPGLYKNVYHPIPGGENLDVFRTVFNTE